MGSKLNNTIFLCYRAHSLCQIWPNLPQIKSKDTWGNPRREISEGRTCPTTQTWTVESIWTDMFIETTFMRYEGHGKFERFLISGHHLPQRVIVITDQI